MLISITIIMYKCIYSYKSFTGACFFIHQIFLTTARETQVQMYNWLVGMNTDRYFNLQIVWILLFFFNKFLCKCMTRSCTLILRHVSKIKTTQNKIMVNHLDRINLIGWVDEKIAFLCRATKCVRCLAKMPFLLIL